jgi:hypothetical protein
MRHHKGFNLFIFVGAVYRARSGPRRLANLNCGGVVVGHQPVITVLRLRRRLLRLSVWFKQCVPYIDSDPTIERERMKLSVHIDGDFPLD